MPITNSSDTRKWCWLESADSEGAFGPFDTREEALADAREREEEGTVILGRCNYADPAEELNSQAAGRLMEELEEDCCDELRNPEDVTFSLKAGVDVRDLDKLIRDWLRANVHAAYFAADGDTYEAVSLEETT